jgi:hypothetical protein
MTNFILAFRGFPKDIGKVIDPTGSILFPPKRYRAFVAFLVAFGHNPSGRRLTKIRFWLGYHYRPVLW